MFQVILCIFHTFQNVSDNFGQISPNIFDLCDGKEKHRRIAGDGQ